MCSSVSSGPVLRVFVGDSERSAGAELDIVLTDTFGWLSAARSSSRLLRRTGSAQLQRGRCSSMNSATRAFVDTAHSLAPMTHPL